MLLTGLLLAVTLCIWIHTEYVANPRVVQMLVEDPDGERAGKVMLLTLPSGRRIPVNFLREGDRVYTAADGRWWRELADGGATVSVWVRGEELTGRATAVRDDPEYTERIFAKLRPNAIKGFGTLVEIQLDGDL
jgi:hypothetical protein